MRPATFRRGIHPRSRQVPNDLGFNSFFKSGWKRFYLKWYDDFLPSARSIYARRRLHCLERIPSVHAAMFAILPPGARLPSHRDPFAGSLRYHLGLSTPNSELCRISVMASFITGKTAKQLFSMRPTFIVQRIRRIKRA